MAQASAGLQLQRSAVSFRRQGSSGVVWNDRFFSGELARPTTRTEPTPRFLSGELGRPNRPQSKSHHRSNRRDNHHHQQPDDLANVVHTAEVNVKPIRTARAVESSRARNSHQDSDEPPSPRLSGCGCCGGLGKSPRSGRTVRSVKPRSR